MNDKSSLPSPARTRQILTAALALIFLLLMFRNTGLYPYVMADEWSYSSMARLMPLDQVSVPSYLYFAVFGVTNSCGDGFLDCSRLFNTAALIGAAPFIYLVARRVAMPAVAALVAVLAMLAPVNVYTSYFMPETSYYFGFWVMTWLVFHFQDRPGLPRAALLGAVLGLLAMIKVHALFLLPALCLYLLWARYEQGGTGWLLHALLMIAAVLAAALAVRLGVGYLLAGKPALSLVGSLYQGQSEYASAVKKPPMQLLTLALSSLRGHLLGLALLGALPLAALGSQLASRAALQASPQRSLAVYALLMLGSMVAVTALFTATVAGNGPFETVARLHLRYYSFTLPLLAMLAAGQCGAAAPATGRTARLLWGVPLAAAVILAWQVLGADFKPNIADSPELVAMTMWPSTLRWTALAGAACLLLWIWRPQYGARVFVLVFIPLFTLASGAAVTAQLRSAVHPDAYDKAGMYVRQYLAPPQTEHLAIAGDNHGGLYKAKYHIDSIPAALVLLPSGQVPSIKDLPAGTRWLLSIGNYNEVPGLVHIQTNEFTLSELLAGGGKRYHINFGKNEYNGYLRRTDGLSELGGDGRWSVQKEVRLEFVKPLPPQLALTLNTNGYGPNIGQALVVQVGDERQSFTLSEAPVARTLQFKNGTDIRSLSLIVPQPVSPQSLGQSSDARTLGVFLREMDISSTDPAIREQLEHDKSPLQR